MQRFDKDQVYIRKWVPELGTDLYPEKIVEHTYARERAISRYKEGLSTSF
jgi:deoxyribodipyrimidine photo-lyase